MPMRIPGMATGMDTDTMVKQMMQPYKMKVDKVKQDRDTIQWKQDMYRDIIKDLKSCYEKYLKPESRDYIMSPKTYANCDIVSENPAVASATGLVGAQAGTYTVNVQRLAESAKLLSGKLVPQSHIAITDVANWAGKSVTLKIGDKEVQLDINDCTDIGQLADELTNKIKGTALEGKLTVQSETGRLKLTSITKEDISIVSDPLKTSVVGDLNTLKGKSIWPQLSLDTKLSDLGVTANPQFTLKCGSKTYDIALDLTKITTLGDAMGAIKSAQSKESDASLQTSLSQDVKVNFSELTGQVTFETVQGGSSSFIEVSGTGLSFLGIADKDNDTGVDATVEITPPGSTTPTTVTKSGNSFTIDGIAYSLSKVDRTTLTVKPNAQASVDKIKEFIGEYNKFVEKINNKIEEKKQYKYLPLTEDQRKDMKEDEIKKWEDAAKVGLLKNDNELSSLVSNLRTAFFDKVEGSGISLKQVGLDTSPDTSRRGQIVIDETKLKNALEQNGDAVYKLFTSSSSSTDTKEKYDQSGVFQRMKDILYDNVGKFDGTLLKKAGIENSLTDFKNQYTDKITEKDKLIKSMEADLATRENSYYTKFAALEKAMNNMNAQSSWLTAQLGGGK